MSDLSTNSTLDVTLGRHCAGADGLGWIARGERGGVAVYTVPGGSTVRGVFHTGRCVSVRQGDADPIVDVDAIEQILRDVAAAQAGRFRFTRVEVNSAEPGVDTLTAAMSGLLALSAEAIWAYWDARAAQSVVPTERFSALARDVTAWLDIPLSSPEAGESVSHLLGRVEHPGAPWAWACLALAGGFEPLEASTWMQPPRRATTFEDPEARRLADDIESAHAVMGAQNHYAFLNLARDAESTAVRDAYFSAAKRWHADHMSALPDPALRAMADALFQRSDAAQKVLSNTDERRAYDWLLSERGTGMAEDADELMSAERWLEKGETALRQGLPQRALPWLYEALGYRGGLARASAFIGFAHYSLRGKSGEVWAEEAFVRALETTPDLPEVFEFRGRMLLAEGRLVEAAPVLERAVALDDTNLYAQRELRLLRRRLPPKDGADDSAPKDRVRAMFQRIRARFFRD